jgi:hypothetical protein
MTDSAENILDRLLANHETHMEWLGRRWSLGPLRQRLAEATPPKREGDPVTGIVVRYVFERATVTWQQDTGYTIEPREGSA